MTYVRYLMPLLAPFSRNSHSSTWLAAGAGLVLHATAYRVGFMVSSAVRPAILIWPSRTGIRSLPSGMIPLNQRSRLGCLIGHRTAVQENILDFSVI